MKDWKVAVLHGCSWDLKHKLRLQRLQYEGQWVHYSIINALLVNAVGSHPQVRKIGYNLQSQCSHNIQILKIGIVFDLAMRYTLGGGHNIIYVLFASLDNVFELIVFNIVICLSQRMRKVFTVGRRWDMILSRISHFNKCLETPTEKCHYRCTLTRFWNLW